MPPRGRLAAAVVAGTALMACGDPGFDRREGADGLRGVELPEPLAVPDFSLTDTSGRPYRFRAETRGRLAFLFFGYTRCPDICPVQLANLAAALGDLPFSDRRRVEVVFVSTDPERDTPERIREWLDRFDREFIGLRGPLERVNGIQRALALPPAVIAGPQDRESARRSDEYLVGHASQILAVTGDGLVRAAYPAGVRQADWRHDLPALLALDAGVAPSATDGAAGPRSGSPDSSPGP